MSRYQPISDQRVGECIARGGHAAESGQPEAACPFGVNQIGERCAWLAGYRDRKKEMRYEM